MKKIFTEKFFSRTSIIIVFLALIRCIAEFFRLDAEMKAELTISAVKPYLCAALICAVAAFIMVLLNFFHKYKLVIASGILTIGALIFLKFYLF